MVRAGFQSHSIFILALVLHHLDIAEGLSCIVSVLFFPA